MTQESPESDSFSLETVAAFAARLEAYAAGLPEQERRALSMIILRAMDPLERMRWRSVTALLDPDEEAVLWELEQEEREG